MASRAISKHKGELERYKKRTSGLSKRAREAPMTAATSTLKVGTIAAGAFGLARSQFDILDSPIGEGVAAGALIAYGLATKSPTAIQAATGLTAVAVHNAAQRFGESLGGADE